jgi:hypothetical protein
MVDPQLIGPATLAVSQGISAFMTFLPSLTDVRKANPGEDLVMAADVRMGEIAAVALTVGVGAVASSLTGSPVPVVVSVTVAVLMLCLYEATLRADRPMEPKYTPLTLAPNPQPEGA